METEAFFGGVSDPRNLMQVDQDSVDSPSVSGSHAHCPKPGWMSGVIVRFACVSLVRLLQKACCAMAVVLQLPAEWLDGRQNDKVPEQSKLLAATLTGAQVSLGEVTQPAPDHN
jgi:hypothetical protein